MKNLNTKLEQYAKQCDEVFLSEHLKVLIEEAHKNVEQIRPEELYIVAKDIILLDVREPEEFASGYINAHAVLLRHQLNI